MFSPRSLRKVLHYVVLASLLIGPMGLGAQAVFASAKACDTTCPCDQEEGGEADVVSGGEASHCQDGVCDSHAEEAQSPCGQHGAHGPCADDCPDCTCCPGVMLAAVPSFVIPYVAPPHPIMTQTAVELPVMSIFSGTFRPPQALI